MKLPTPPATGGDGLGSRRDSSGPGNRPAGRRRGWKRRSTGPISGSGDWNGCPCRRSIFSASGPAGRRRTGRSGRRWRRCPGCFTAKTTHLPSGETAGDERRPAANISVETQRPFGLAPERGGQEQAMQNNGKVFSLLTPLLGLCRICSPAVGPGNESMIEKKRSRGSRLTAPAAIVYGGSVNQLNSLAQILPWAGSSK